ncbi:hypothetical protein [Thiocapsa sp.]|uniref:hypothetical protein n=1 Tax=Thiocapsa sp. TaxID=2024551 RepID=UPI002CC5C2B0|nr:hypothetical protein [Thiocapsa sp.]HSO81614.1 hypothetical protein [Thiocapsa sp.]
MLTDIDFSALLDDRTKRISGDILWLPDEDQAAWFDLNHFSAGPEALRFVSLFDDTADVWSPEDFVLLEPLSTVTRWSQPDVFADVLADAA